MNTVAKALGATFIITMGMAGLYFSVLFVGCVLAIGAA